VAPVAEEEAAVEVAAVAEEEGAGAVLALVLVPASPIRRS